MGLVDEKDGAPWEAAQVAQEGGSGLSLESPGPQSQGGGDAGDETEGGEGGEGEGDELVVGGVQGLGEQGEGRGFAAAAFSDEEGDGVAFESEVPLDPRRRKALAGEGERERHPGPCGGGWLPLAGRAGRAGG